MSSLNRVVLVGRLTKDPELKYTPNGVATASFTLAVNRSFTNQAGEREADFINCQVWRKPAENVANFLKKGSLAGVDGRIQTRNFEGQDGRRVFMTEVVAESVQFLEPKGQSSNQSSNQNSNQPPYTREEKDPFVNDGQPIDISDDDLPF
jgi:single-strand DNA-binding protein